MHAHSQAKQINKESKNWLLPSLKTMKDWPSNRLINSRGPWKTQGSHLSKQGHNSPGAKISKWPPGGLKKNVLSHNIGPDPATPGGSPGGGREGGPQLSAGSASGNLFQQVCLLAMNILG